jgi:hypothetical protein
MTPEELRRNLRQLRWELRQSRYSPSWRERHRQRIGLWLWIIANMVATAGTMAAVYAGWFG